MKSGLARYQWSEIKMPTLRYTLTFDYDTELASYENAGLKTIEEIVAYEQEACDSGDNPIEEMIAFGKNLKVAVEAIGE